MKKSQTKKATTSKSAQKKTKGTSKTTKKKTYDSSLGSKFVIIIMDFSKKMLLEDSYDDFKRV